ncbi:MAG: hypothetical protein JO320_02365 [Alphaproteobacteria bacterium]|nr:hypothetical protein [Alphaproteobacteria bacterium]
MVDVETLLAGLYANGLSVTLEWRRSHGIQATRGDPELVPEWRSHGFQAKLGYPGLGHQSFHRSGEAVRWLKEQALLHYPIAEFAPERDQVDVQAEAILTNLYGSHIGRSIEWIWNGGFYVSLI